MHSDVEDHRKGAYKKKTDKKAWFLKCKYFKGLGLKKLPLHIQRLFYFYAPLIIYICLAAVFQTRFFLAPVKAGAFFVQGIFIAALKIKHRI